jgi:hypothetical protein
MNPAAFATLVVFLAAILILWDEISPALTEVPWWAWTACGVAAVASLPYALLPLLVRSQHWQRADPDFPPFDPDGPKVPPAAAAWLRSVAEAWRAEGFVLLGCVRNSDSIPNLAGWMAVFERPESHDGALAVWMTTTVPDQPPQVTAFVEVAARFPDGRRLSTYNSPFPNQFPLPPGKRFVHLPQCADPVRLYRVHAHVRRTDYAGATAESRLKDGPTEALRESWRREMAEHSAAGYLCPDEAAGVCHMTWKGAYLLTWKNLWPWSHLRKAASRRAAERLLAEVPR